MKRLDGSHDTAGAETVGALVLFGIFVMTIAYLNVTAVPQAGLAAEEEHFLTTLSALNSLQASAEGAARPGGEGTTVGTALQLGPTQTAGSDFFSFFVATPTKASGELVHNASYGSIRLHHEELTAGRVDDIGSDIEGLPLGQLLFDPHPAFRNEGVVSLENGAIVTTDGSTQTLRYEPSIALRHTPTETVLAMSTRILNGTSASQGGSGPARIALTTEDSTLVPAPRPNAMSVTLRIETRYGTAWGAYLNATATEAGLTSGAGFDTTVLRGGGLHGLDLVTWRIEGTGTGNDIRFTSGLAIYNVHLS